MIRMRDVALACEWQRIDRLVSRRISSKWTGEATTTMLNELERNLEVVSEVAIEMYSGQPEYGETK